VATDEPDNNREESTVLLGDLYSVRMKLAQTVIQIQSSSLEPTIIRDFRYPPRQILRQYEYLNIGHNILHSRLFETAQGMQLKQHH
jgi:hypothetical protein